MAENIKHSIDIPKANRLHSPSIIKKIWSSIKEYTVQYYHVFILLGIVLLTYFVYQGSINNLFTNWDDMGYVTNNPLIKDMSFAGIKALFRQPVMGNYHPFTMLSYAIEYSHTQLDPWWYHADSLLLHIMVTCLVYWWVCLLFHKPFVATIVTLFFALHPLHVESVAWVSGRKDLLLGLFYIGACIAYCFSLLAVGRRKCFFTVLTFILFIAALLSKAVAVTLPLTLLLTDYIKNRRWNKQLLIEKIPYFIFALAFGILALKYQQDFGSLTVSKVQYTFLDRLALGCYALTTYLWKSILPIQLSCYYPYPTKTAGLLPTIYYCYPIEVVLFTTIALIWGRKNKIIVFGLLFFLVNIALLLQLIPVGDAIIAERYTYLSYIGLFIIIGYGINILYERTKSVVFRLGILIAILLYINYLCFASNKRCKAWYDSISLWQAELENASLPSPVLYSNLGAVYFEHWYNATDKFERKRNYDNAFYILNKTKELWANDVSPYQGLAMLYVSKGKYDSADLCLKTALSIEPTVEAYSNYGNFLLMIGKTDKAIDQYTIAIGKNPDLYENYLNRGKALKQINHWDEALKDFNTGTELNQSAATLYYERSFCDTQKGLKPIALQDVEHAISLGFDKVDTAYYRWLKEK